MNTKYSAKHDVLVECCGVILMWNMCSGSKKVGNKAVRVSDSGNHSISLLDPTYCITAIPIRTKKNICLALMYNVVATYLHVDLREAEIHFSLHKEQGGKTLAPTSLNTTHQLFTKGLHGQSVMCSKYWKHVFVGLQYLSLMFLIYYKRKIQCVLSICKYLNRFFFNFHTGFKVDRSFFSTSITAPEILSLMGPPFYCIPKIWTVYKNFICLWWESTAQDLMNIAIFRLKTLLSSLVIQEQYEW